MHITVYSFFTFKIDRDIISVPFLSQNLCWKSFFFYLVFEALKLKNFKKLILGVLCHSLSNNLQEIKIN